MKCIGYIAVLLLVAAALASAQMQNKGWWKDTVFYQIYPRSFKDDDGDGVGDLKGITKNLQHFNDSGVGAIWLSPINRSPMFDFGYDISDFKDIDKTFGNLNDFKDLVVKAKALGLKVILDLVPNHTSDQHQWFQMSLNKTGKYTDYYIWSDGKMVDGKRQPPNNWVSVFNGSAWTWNDQRQQYYFHQFYKQQPDLNYDNLDVQDEMKDTMRFWLDKGVDGFRIDAVPHLFESNITQDEPVFNIPNVNASLHVNLNHTLTKDQPKTYDLVNSWRLFVDEYANQTRQDEKVIMTEAYTSWENTIKYYEHGSNVPFNFKFITDANADSTATDFQNIIQKWIAMMPKGKVPNWVMGNHDRVRLATRFPGRADQMTMLAMILPGVAVTYYGEEIGMEDNTTLRVFDFRDGCRTPFQWNSSTSAGFSTNSTTWLPVNTKYTAVNLAQEKIDVDSHYKLYTELTSLRKTDALKNGGLSTAVLNKDILAVMRNGAKEIVTLLINFSGNTNITADLSGLVKGTLGTRIEVSSVGSSLPQHAEVNLKSVSVPAKVSVVLVSRVSGATAASVSILTVLAAAILSLLRS